MSDLNEIIAAIRHYGITLETWNAKSPEVRIEMMRMFRAKQRNDIQLQPRAAGEAAHTATPYRLEKKAYPDCWRWIIVDQNGTMIADCGVVYGHVRHGDEGRKERAEFVLRALNAYAPTLALLKRARVDVKARASDFIHVTEGVRLDARDTLKDIDTTIKLAGEEGK